MGIRLFYMYQLSGTSVYFYLFYFIRDATMSDRKLLEFNTYNEYLDSFVTHDDLCYLRSTLYGRQVAALGYRCTSDVLTRKQFDVGKRATREALYPSRKLHSLVSDHCPSSDNFLQELALRERSNRLFILSVYT